MFLSMVLEGSLVQLTIPVDPLFGVLSDPISMEASIEGHLVRLIQHMNLLVYPINFFFLVHIARVIE